MNNPKAQRLVFPTVVCLLLLALLGAGCDNNAGTTKPEAGAPRSSANESWPIVCVGRIEPVDGEVEVAAQMAGTLEQVWVKEGDTVTNGMLLTIVDARREKAQVILAEARLKRLKAGAGAEERAAVQFQREALEAELIYARNEFERARKLHATAVIGVDELELKQQRVAALQKQVESSRKQYEAMQRGPLPEEIEVARAELLAAQAAFELREVRAPFGGVILQIYRHTGDQSLVNWPTPILKMADTNRLQVRLEIAEAEVYRLRVGMKGSFTIFGMTNALGRLTVQTILPVFGPKRLFDPDGNARQDTRTLAVLCELTERFQPVYSGQRVLVRMD